jgi:hypothetical protein
MSLLVCPHCEKSLGADHDEKACHRKMSRRFFFGLAVAPLAAAIAAKLPPAPVKRVSCEIYASVAGDGLPGTLGWYVAPAGIDRILEEMVADGQIELVIG